MHLLSKTQAGQLYIYLYCEPNPSNDCNSGGGSRRSFLDRFGVIFGGRDAGKIPKMSSLAVSLGDAFRRVRTSASAFTAVAVPRTIRIPVRRIRIRIHLPTFLRASVYSNNVAYSCHRVLIYIYIYIYKHTRVFVRLLSLI
jgi:hypothetical protein